MSSKLVKKLLQQTAVPVTSSEHDDGSQHRSRNRYIESKKSKSTPKVSKEDMVQEHVQSLLRLDQLINKHSSKTANDSFDRHSSNIKRDQKQKQSLKRKNAAGAAVSNSRSSSSSFSQKPHEKRFDKQREKRNKEEGYFEDLARALKKAKKKGKKKRSA